MRLEKASYKAISYACLHFHYAKRIPAQPMTGINIFNDIGEWCGVVVFNIGIGNISKPFNLPNGAVCELVRVALNGKQETTSKAVSLAMKFFKKLNPLCKLLVSYADSDQSHKGTIYQAMNWYFISAHNTGDKFIDPKTGKDIHSRAHSPKGFNVQFGIKKKVLNTQDLTRIKTGVKYKYIFPLDKSLIPMCKDMAKPYPKPASVVQGSTSGNQSEDGGRPDPDALNQSDED
jgi:hypothetical protein